VALAWISKAQKILKQFVNVAYSSTMQHDHSFSFEETIKSTVLVRPLPRFEEENLILDLLT